MWRSRQWRKLLNFIDRLPPTSQYAQEMANDEEYAQVLIEQLGEDKDKSLPRGPQLTQWTLEASLLSMLVDEARLFRTTFVQANSEKGKTVKQPPMMPTPITAIMRALDRRRRAQSEEKHQELVARVLPRKAGNGDIVTDE